MSSLSDNIMSHMYALDPFLYQIFSLTLLIFVIFVLFTMQSMPTPDKTPHLGTLFILHLFTLSHTHRTALQNVVKTLTFY